MQRAAEDRKQENMEFQKIVAYAVFFPFTFAACATIVFQFVRYLLGVDLAICAI